MTQQLNNSMIITPIYGDVLIFNADVLFSKVQHVSTERWIKDVSPASFGPGNRSHSAFCAGVVCGETSLLEAEEKVVIDSWKNSMNIPHRIYRFKAPAEAIEQMMHSLFVKDANQWYGFLRLPYFPYRKVVERYLKIDVRRQKPMFPSGVICSEEFWLGGVMISQIMGWNDLHDYLDEWRGDNFHSSDTQSVLDAFTPKYLELIDSYNLPT